MKHNFYNKNICYLSGLAGIMSFAAFNTGCTQKTEKPNIILIYADDIGYGDLSCYNNTAPLTTNVDRLASQGLLFTNAHCTSATSTPSRYSLLTGQYAWRKRGTGVARGNAAAIIQPGRTTIASVLQRAGYTTGVIGKWHLGLGPEGGPDWNCEIMNSPLDIGFDYSFLIPATGDRVPCVYVENRHIVGLDTDDPITVSYDQKTGDWPTGRENPELLKMHPSHGHDMTIVNGISRIGYMTGGKAALWVDENMADTITAKAVQFIKKNHKNPFFLYFATHDIHVPRVPHPRFKGKSGMGPRGDAILEFDWSVGEIVKTVEDLGLTRNTVIIVTSDNGPVVDDGYRDDAVEKLGDHRPAGPLRGGKYSLFDGGTRIPFIIKWERKIKPQVSDALFSQIDLLASFAKLTGQELSDDDGPDSFNNLDILLGKSQENREWLIEHAARLTIIKDDWKYIESGEGEKVFINVNIETGYDTLPQLYNLREDLGEMNNVAAENPDIVIELTDMLDDIKEN